MADSPQCGVLSGGRFGSPCRLKSISGLARCIDHASKPEMLALIRRLRDLLRDAQDVVPDDYGSVPCMECGSGGGALHAIACDVAILLELPRKDQ